MVLGSSVAPIEEIHDHSYKTAVLLCEPSGNHGFPCSMLANLPQFLPNVDLLRTQSRFDSESFHHIYLC